MKRWELGVWTLAIIVIITMLTIFLYRQLFEESFLPKSVSNNQINPNALSTSSGSYFPAPADEDVIVKQKYLAESEYVLGYDYDNKNWQIEIIDEDQIRLHQLKYIDKTNQFFYYNDQLSLWDEVEPEILSEELRSLTNIETVLLTDQQLIHFRNKAKQDQSEKCQRDKSAICAVWEAENFNNAQRVVIYVNQRTRKIDHIVTLNISDQTEESIIVDYYYQPVNLLAPNKENTRYLPPQSDRDNF